MKTRTWTAEMDTIRPIGAVPNGVEYGTKPTYSERLTVGESITWATSGGRKAYHWCTAHKTNYQANPDALAGTGSYSPGVFRLTYQGSGKVTCTENQPGAVTFLGSRPRYTVTCGPSEDEVLDAIASASVSLASSPIRPMMNLPQAIIELKDIPKTLRAVPRLAGFLKGPGAKLGLGSTVKEVASAYLAYVFGVKPTIHDVDDFMGQVPERVRIGVRQVRYKAGQPVRAGFVLRDEDTLSEYRSATTSWSGQFSLRGPSAMYPIVDVAVVGQAGLNSTTYAPRGTTVTKAVPWLAQYQVISREVSGVVFGRVAVDYARDFGWMDDIKLNASPIATGWELIPFSFVVDWFVDVGRWLREANKLSEARLSGFVLEDGVWLSKRDSSVTYLPVCDYDCHAEWDGYHPGESYPCRFNVSTTKAVRLEPFTAGLSYGRGPYRNRIAFPRLRIRGLSQQSAFQWSAGSALAIQACAGLK